MKNNNRAVLKKDIELLLKSKKQISLYRAGKKIGILELLDNNNISEITFKKINLTNEYPRGYNLFTFNHPEEYLGIGSTNSSLGFDRFLRREPVSSEIKKAFEISDNLFQDIIKEAFVKDSIKVIRLDLLNLIRNEVPYYVCTSHLTTIENNLKKYYSLFYVYPGEGNIKEDGYYKLSLCTSQDDKCVDYNQFLDVFDYDNNGSYDIFYINTGYENQDLVILENIKGKWQEIKRISLWSY